MLKKLLIVLLVGIFTFSNLTLVSANDTYNTIAYDLEKGGTQEFIIHDEDGNKIEITVKEIPSLTRTIDNGTYEIATSRAGSWKARFQIAIQNYKIISGGHATATAITGSFVSKNFKIDSSTMATYYLKRRIGIIISNIYLRAQIENRNLKVIVR